MYYSFFTSLHDEGHVVGFLLLEFMNKTALAILKHNCAYSYAYYMDIHFNFSFINTEE